MIPEVTDSQMPKDFSLYVSHKAPACRSLSQFTLSQIRKGQASLISKPGVISYGLRLSLPLLTTPLWLDSRGKCRLFWRNLKATRADKIQSLVRHVSRTFCARHGGCDRGGLYVSVNCVQKHWCSLIFQPRDLAGRNLRGERQRCAMTKDVKDLPSGEVEVATPPSREAFNIESGQQDTAGHVVVVEPADSKAPGVVDAVMEREALLSGWRRHNEVASLQEVNSSISVPEGSWYKKAFAFAGLGFMVSVAYMDPGNWATDLSGGAAFGYTLLSVILLSNFTAIFLQSLALKLGIVADRDLAQACRDAYPKYVVYILWIMMEIAIAATDLAEVIGSAVAMNLLFGLPLWAGVLITAVDTLFILVFGSRSFRSLEVVVFTLCLLIAGVFVYELIAVKPEWIKVAGGLYPKPEILTNSKILFNAIGILGATCMPHSLFLHSSIIQTRAYPRTKEGQKMAVKYGTWDSCLSLMLAFFVNASILILAAAAFHYGPHANHELANISDAYKLLAPALGDKAARILFGVGLLASGQNSTIIGTLSGQVVMEGFLKMKIKPWLRRFITRSIAIIPAAIVAAIGGNNGAGRLLVLSQVILSFTLIFAVVPLVHFTSSRAKMGSFVNCWVATIAAWIIAVIIGSLNAYLVVQSIRQGSFGQAGHV